MKLRVRSMASRGGGDETHRLDVPDSATLMDLKTLLATKLGASSLAAPPVPAESIRLSLNRSDELLSPSPTASLPSLGLTSGDLLFFSLSPLPAPPPSYSSTPPPQTLGAVPPEVQMGDSAAAAHPNPNPTTAAAAQTAGSIASPEMDMVEVAEMKSSSGFVLRLLKQEMEAEKAGAEGSLLGRLVVAVHAALLDAGFVAANPSGSRLRLPQYWALVASSGLTVRYTVPELLGRGINSEGGMVVVLNYLVLGNFVTVYGSLSGTWPEVHRLCLDAAMLAPLLSLDMDSVGGVEEEEILELWKVLKDGLCLPLMVGLCLENGLPLPPCLMGLSGDLKAKILEFLPGADITRVECTCKEFRNLALDDNLWRRKYEEEFKSGSESFVPGRSWKQRFAKAWAVKAAASKGPRRANPRLWSFGRRYNPVSPYRFPVIGGDYDWFPAIGDLNMPGPRFGNHRRNFSPQCNLGGHRDGFIE